VSVCVRTDAMMKVSLPKPPDKLSVSVPPLMMSLPAPPSTVVPVVAAKSVSAFAEPVMLVAPVVIVARTGAADWIIAAVPVKPEALIVSEDALVAVTAAICTLLLPETFSVAEPPVSGVMPIAPKVKVVAAPTPVELMVVVSKPPMARSLPPPTFKAAVLVFAMVNESVVAMPVSLIVTPPAARAIVVMLRVLAPASKLIVPVPPDANVTFDKPA